MLTVEVNEQTLDAPLDERVKEGVALAYSEQATSTTVASVISTPWRTSLRPRLSCCRHEARREGQAGGSPSQARLGRVSERARPGTVGQSRTIQRLPRACTTSSTARSGASSAPAATVSIQSRLNSGSGLILCRTTGDPLSRVGCLRDEGLRVSGRGLLGPHKAAMKKLADRYAKNLVMATDRLPEFGSKFERELMGASKAPREQHQHPHARPGSSRGGRRTVRRKRRKGAARPPPPPLLVYAGSRTIPPS